MISFRFMKEEYEEGLPFVITQLSITSQMISITFFGKTAIIYYGPMYT